MKDMEEVQATADARQLAGALGKLPEPEIKPALVVVSGLPGTGKTHFCTRLAERLPFAMLESDALRKVLFPEPTYTAAESMRLFPSIHLLIDELLKKGIPVILDATNLTEQHRSYLYSIAEHQNARLILVNVKAPAEVVEARLRTRQTDKKPGEKSDADWEVYQAMKPRAEGINRRHYVVDTSQDITPVLNKIVREIQKGT